MVFVSSAIEEAPQFCLENSSKLIPGKIPEKDGRLEEEVVYEKFPVKGVSFTEMKVGYDRCLKSQPSSGWSTASPTTIFSYDPSPLISPTHRERGGGRGGSHGEDTGLILHNMVSWTICGSALSSFYFKMKYQCSR